MMVFRGNRATGLGLPQSPAGISLESTQVTLSNRMDIVPAKCCVNALTHPIISVCPRKEGALSAFFL